MSETKEEPAVEEQGSATETQKEPTAEDLKKQKAELTKFYKEQLPLLRLQAEYEECITRIDIAKMQRFEIMMQKAQMMAPPPGPGEDGPQAGPPQDTGEHVRPFNTDKDPAAPKEERKLKKQE